MNKNYINVIRNSVNKSKEGKQKFKKSRKVVFPLSNYSSESAFLDDEDILYKSRKGTLKRKVKSSIKKNNKKILKKTKVVINAQHQQDSEVSSDSSNESLLTPSKSEIAVKRKKAKIPTDSNSHSELKHDNECIDMRKNKPKICSDSDENDSEFELDDFSNSRDHYCNESITEAYSGIEDEFIAASFKKIKISRNKIIDKDDIDIIFNNDDINLSSSSFNNSNIVLKNNIKKYNKDNDHKTFSNTTERKQLPKNLGSYGDRNEVHNNDNSKSSATNDITNELENGTCESEPLETNAEYFDFENFKVVILKNQKSIPFFGNCLLKVLKGKIQILGSTLDKSSETTEIYSPRGFSLLVIKNISFIENDVHLKDLHDFPNSTDKILNTIVEKDSAVFLCYKMHNQRLTFVQKYISQQIFPKIQNESFPQIVFEPKDMAMLLESDEWEDIIKLVNISTRMFIAGGKGVGKSTFLRFAINKILLKFDEIRVIDLDPGQSEFFVPGCVSVINVSQKCIGPNFTHIKKPERSYLCDISVTDPAAYIRNVQCLMDYVSHLDKMPTLINFMGYSKGLGIKIASTVITLVQPTNVIQIESKHKKRNFDCDLSISNIKKHCNYFGGEVTGLNYRVHKLSSLAEDTSGWKLQPSQARELCIMAYLGEGMTDTIDSLTNHDLPMYEINLSSVKLTDLNRKKVPAAAVNANLVALCTEDQIENTFICHGFGVVRGIDLENDYLVLITQEDPEILDEVSHLVSSSISLPPSIYMTPQNIRGSMPYVMEGSLTSLAQFTKRSYMPAGHTTGK